MQADDDARRAAAELGELFPAIYLRFHERRPKRAVRFTPQMWAVVQHLALSGPLTVTEAARHMDRAQSVMSATIDALVARGVLERMRDARDRRRTLVWLTDAGHEAIQAGRRVLSHERLTDALRELTAAERRGLLDGMRALLGGGARPADVAKGSTKKRVGKERTR